MQRLLLLGLLAFSACSFGSGPSVPDEGETPDAAPAEPEAAPAEVLEDDEPDPRPSPTVGDASALSVPHDMPPLDTSCETRRNFATGHVKKAVEFAAAGCSVDADCVRVARGTGCRGGCPASILSTHEPAYETLRTSIEERVCSTYRDDGCPYATPRCVGGDVRCVEGTCSLGPS